MSPSIPNPTSTNRKTIQNWWMFGILCWFLHEVEVERLAQWCTIMRKSIPLRRGDGVNSRNDTITLLLAVLSCTAALCLNPHESWDKVPTSRASQDFDHQQY